MLSGTVCTLYVMGRSDNMSAPNYYVQRIKDFDPKQLEKRIKMMEDGGFTKVSDGREFKAWSGRVEYYAVMRRDLNET